MNITFEEAWQKNDPKQAEEAKAFWEAYGLLPPPMREARAHELVALVRVDDAVAGVATARLEYQPPLRGRFAMYRCAVAPDFQHHAVPDRLTAYARQVLEGWSREHPNEKVLGMAAILDPREYREKQPEPVWPDYGLNLNLVGYSGQGEQIRVAWFDHARVETGAVSRSNAAPAPPYRAI